jgi:hypothetical protein
MGVNKRLIGAGAAGGAFVNNENFRVVTYTGNGGTQSITGVGFQPDFVWHKSRSSAHDHNLTDSTRGVKKGLNINDPRAEGNQDPLGVTSFDADGFTVNDNSGGGASVNGNGITYVVWCWKGGGGPTSNSDGSITSTVNANPAAGFSIVKYTGTGSSGSVGHGLNSDPKLIINKKIASSADWLAGAVTWTKYLEPNGTPPFRTANVWTDTQPTSTTFGVINSTSTSSVEYITYCFADVAGYQKISTYTGNGSTNGPFVNVGFEPAYVMVKNLDSTDNWLVFDNARNTSNPRTQLLQWNLNAAESTEAGAVMSFYSNGFQSVGTGGGGGSGQINSNGDTYLYWAIAANPDTEAPTLASSFNVKTYTGTGAARSITGFGFRPDFVWGKNRDASEAHFIYDSLRGASKLLESNSTIASTTVSSRLTDFESDGFTIGGSDGSINASGNDYVAWGWKADDNEPTINSNGSVTSITSVNDNAGFSVVKATAPSSGVFTVGHGLSSALDFFVIKRLDSTGGWIVYFRDLGSNKYLLLNDSAAAATDTNFFDNTHPTSTVFTLNAGQSIVGGADFVAYCFANVTGYSKFGSYTGTGSSNSITTGFKTDFLIVKEADGVDSWEMYDSLRGSNKVVYPNGNNAEVTGSTLTSFDSNGFTVSSATSINESGKTYIYWAVAMNPTLNTTLANSFKTVTYTGTGSAQSITSLGFQPDLVWLKDRGNTREHILSDSVRGSIREVSSDTADAEEKDRGVSTFDTDGFTLPDGNTNYNASSQSYVAWCWKAGNNYVSNISGTNKSAIVNANTANGFSIIKYTGTSASSQSVGHGLSSTPELVMIKKLTGSESWIVWYPGASTTNFLELNGSSATQTGATWGGTHSSTVVNLQDGPSARSSSDGQEYIAYVWHSVAGFSKIGTYTGTGSDSNAVTTGFKPDFLMVKRVDSSGGWLVFDSARSPSNPVNDRIEWNNNQAEQTDSGSKFVDFNTNDFEANGSDSELNASGATYLYMAIKMN